MHNITVNTVSYLQPPQEKLLGQRMVQKGQIMKLEIDKMYYIPLLDSLKKLLQMDLVRDCVSYVGYVVYKTQRLFLSVL